MANLHMRPARTVWKEWYDGRVSQNFLAEAAQCGDPTTSASKQMRKVFETESETKEQLQH